MPRTDKRQQYDVPVSEEYENWQNEMLAVYMFKHLIATALVTTFYFYASVARVALGMLFCVRLGQSGHQWVMDVRQACPMYDPHTHKFALVLGVLALVFCLAWPVSIAAVLFNAAHTGALMRQISGKDCRKRDRARAVLTFRHADYAVDYAEFSGPESKAWRSHGWRKISWLEFEKALKMHVILAWDSILDLQRFILVLVSLCVVLHEVHQLILMIMTLGAYLLLIIMVKPWRAAAVQRLQLLALTVLVTSCLGILVCSVGADDADYTAQEIFVYIQVVAWVVVALNAFYLAVALYMLLRCTITEYNQTVRDVYRRLLLHLDKP